MQDLTMRQLKKGGSAEIFGAEMAPEKLYVFGQECKASVFTWNGCTLEMSLYDRERISNFLIVSFTISLIYFDLALITTRLWSTIFRIRLTRNNDDTSGERRAAPRTAEITSMEESSRS